MTELLQMDIKSILNLLLLNLISYRERVLCGIKLLAKMNQSQVVYDTDEKIVRSLQWSLSVATVELSRMRT